MKRLSFLCCCMVSFGILEAQQKVGIGTTTPQGKLHVSSGTLTNAQYIGTAVGIFENSTTSGSSFLQLMNPSTQAYSISSGTDVSFYRSGISFQADSSLTFETGGFAQRMKIDKSGIVNIPYRLGIGPTDPESRLHVSNGTLANAQYINAAVSVFEASNTLGNSFLQLMNPSTRPFSIGSGTEVAFYRSGISFQADSSVTFETGGFTSRMKIDKAGLVTIPNRLGVGNTNPATSLHVSSTGTLANAQYISTAVSLFENSSTVSNAFLQLMNPSTRPFSIGSGTDVAFYRSGISFQADSSLTFETGGFVQRMKIDKAGLVTIPNRLGIGNTDPKARLHVSSGTLSNAQYILSATSVFENSNSFSSSFLQLMNPSTQAFSIGSGTDVAFYRSGISFQADSSVTIDAGGNTPRMSVTKNGSVGIGTTTPAARLEVNGSVILGTNGTVLTEVIKGSFNKDVQNIPANSSVTEIFTVPNVQTNSTVYISPSSALPNGLIIGYARVFPANNVEVRFTNVTVSAINMAAMDFYITVIR